MKTIINKIILIMAMAVTTALSGCVTTEGAFKRLDNQWVGKDIDEFVLTNGTPYKQFNLKNNDILYTWNSGTSTYYTQINGGGSISSLYCEVQLQVNSKGIIKKFMILKDTWGEWDLSRCHETLK